MKVFEMSSLRTKKSSVASVSIKQVRKMGRDNEYDALNLEGQKTYLLHLSADLDVLRSTAINAAGDVTNPFRLLRYINRRLKWIDAVRKLWVAERSAKIS